MPVKNWIMSRCELSAALLNMYVQSPVLFLLNKLLFRNSAFPRTCIYLQVTWFDTGLCFSPGLFKISSSCRLLKLDTPRDFTRPASLHASRAYTEWGEKYKHLTLHFELRWLFYTLLPGSGLLNSSTCMQSDHYCKVKQQFSLILWCDFNNKSLITVRRKNEKTYNWCDKR